MGDVVYLTGLPDTAGKDCPAGERINIIDHLGLYSDHSYLVRAQGDGLVDSGIHSGDLLVVSIGPKAKNGDVVVVMMAGQFIIKDFFDPTLHIADPLQSDDITILGVVTFTIRAMV